MRQKSWSRGYRRKLTIERSWVWIPATYTYWCVMDKNSQKIGLGFLRFKNCFVKRWKKRKRRPEFDLVLCYKICFGHLVSNQSYVLFLKIGHSRPLFLYFCLFYKQLTVNKCSIKVADDWIRTQVLWYQKRPLCQLRHNHWPIICAFNTSCNFFYLHPQRNTKFFCDIEGTSFASNK